MKFRYQVASGAAAVSLAYMLATGQMGDLVIGDAAQASMPPPAAPAQPGLCPTGCPQYPGDDAPVDARARWMGTFAQQHGIPPELPVMAGLVESGMRNLNYGDSDSVGLFQMRLSKHSAKYPGYPSNPNLQMQWFVDTARDVIGQRVAKGQPTGPPNYGEIVADIERPRVDLRWKYQPKLQEARVLLGLA